MDKDRFWLTGAPNFDKVRVQISESIATEIVNAGKSLFACVEIEESFDEVVEDYLDLENTLLAHSVRNMATHCWSREHLAAARREVGRKVGHVISAGWNYFDRLDKSTARMRFQDQSGVPKKEDLKKCLRERNEDFLIVNQIRNYLVHNGRVVHNIVFGGGWEGEGDDQRMNQTVVPFWYPEKLAEDPKMSRNAKAILQQYGAKTQIMPFVRGYLEAIDFAHREIRDSLVDHIGTWKVAYRGGLERYVDIGGRYPSVGVYRETSNGSERLVSVFNEVIDDLTAFSDKNAGLVNFKKRMVSNSLSNGGR